MDSKKFVVYRIRNNINGCIYFGSTNNFTRRVAEHKAAMKDYTKITNTYCRDIDKNGYTFSDFSFRVVARFDNSKSMLDYEQIFINRHFGTSICYNKAFEVTNGRLKKMIIAWNIHTLEVRIYLSNIAVCSDLGISRILVEKLLSGDLLFFKNEKLKFNTWVIEDWDKKRTLEEVISIYTMSSIKLPPHAMDEVKFYSDDEKAPAPIPGYCSIPELIDREFYKTDFVKRGAPRGPERIRIRPNHEKKFWFRIDSEGSKYNYTDPVRIWKKSHQTEFSTYIPEGYERMFFVPED